MERGVSLYDYFNGKRPWPQLIRFLTRLPGDSHYQNAVARDESIAKARMKHWDKADIDKDEVGGPPSFVGYTRTVAMLAHVVARLDSLITTTIALQLPRGHSPPRISPLPYPRSRFDELKEAFRESHVDDLASRFGLRD